MQKLTDEYFKRQTAKLISNGEKDWEFIPNDNPVYLMLKTVARDQRYACVEAVQEYDTDVGDFSNLTQVIKNA